MKFLKNLSFLLLFLYGNSCFSSFLPNVENPFLEEITEESHIYAESAVAVYDGVLSIPAKIIKNSLCTFSLNSTYQYSSSLEEQMATNYFPYSRRISPSLDISAIIFPFHIFL